jgi:hypothetical protein
MTKRILVQARVRGVPREGFSWVDRRFVREYAGRLERDAVLLYLFLATVADKHGVSYFGAESIAERTGLGAEALRQARSDLLRLDLIAHEHPLYQVLSLPERDVLCAEPLSLGGLFAKLSAGGIS